MEPAQAPMNIRITSSVLENHGHRSKSDMAKPVVLMMDATVKEAWWIACLRESNCGRMFTVMAAMLSTVMPAKVQSSSLCRALRNRLTSRR